MKFKLQCYLSSYVPILWFKPKQPHASPKLDPISQVQSILGLSPRILGPKPLLDQDFFIGPYWADNFFLWSCWAENLSLGPPPIGPKAFNWLFLGPKNHIWALIGPKPLNWTNNLSLNISGPRTLIGPSQQTNTPILGHQLGWGPSWDGWTIKKKRNKIG